MDVFQHIPHILWVHMQGLTSLDIINTLECCPSKQLITKLQTRLGEDCKNTKQSLGWCTLCYDKPQAIDVFPHIPNFFWVHVQGLTIIGYNQYTWFHPSKPQSTKAAEQILRELQNHQIILRMVYVVTSRTKGYGCVTTHHMCLGGMRNVWQAAYHTISTLRCHLCKPRSSQKVQTRLDRNCKQPCHSRGDICFDMKNQYPSMSCHIFHMSCECICKVWKDWDTINTLGYLL